MAELPSSFKKLALVKETTEFREAVNIVEDKFPELGENEILVKNKYVGVNATDVNVTAGRFYGTKTTDSLGFEAVGEVIQIGKKVESFKIGNYVAYLSDKAYAEYANVEEAAVHLLSDLKPEYVALLVSGLTASIGLDKAGRLDGQNDKVLITAAAGGCGHIAVQWAKAAGCHVIGTCSSEKKEEILKELGCDRVINYRNESLDDVLTKEYPDGIDVMWETIGGEVFETCLKHVATKGRVIVVGAITGYKSQSFAPSVDLSQLPVQLLFKSAAVQGFLVLHYIENFANYFKYLEDRLLKNELKIILDNGTESLGKEFVGLESIADAVEHLHSGNSIGKVMVRLY